MMSPTEKSVVLKSLDVKGDYKAVDEKVVVRCHKITRLIQEEDEFDENESSSLLDEMLTSCDNQEEKVAVKIIGSLVHTLLNNNSKKEPKVS